MFVLVATPLSSPLSPPTSWMQVSTGPNIAETFLCQSVAVCRILSSSSPKVSATTISSLRRIVQLLCKVLSAWLLVTTAEDAQVCLLHCQTKSSTNSQSRRLVVISPLPGPVAFISRVSPENSSLPLSSHPPGSRY